MGVWNALEVRRALRNGAPFTMAKVLVVLSLAMVLACIGMSIDVMVESSKFSLSWWSWLLSAVSAAGR